MGSGTWTISGTGNVWMGSSAAAVLYKDTANIVLSDTSTSARTFNGAGFSYNKLTIGGTTGTSTTTIQGDNQFTELASTKTVAHTVAIGSANLYLGSWTITGTAGNIVSVTGSAVLYIVGARVSGVDYLAMGTTRIIDTYPASPGEFYAGANSTGTGTGIILTAAPAAVTRYWVGGTGTWDATTTTNWSATSGGAGGASVPTSVDNVIFNTSSSTANAAYTVTIGTNAVVRCANLTMNGPGAGNKITWTVGLGTPVMILHGNFNLAGGTAEITRVYNSTIILSGSSTGRTFTTNGVALSSTTIVNGVGCGWTLGSAIDIGTLTLTVTNGTFDTGVYNVTAGAIAAYGSNSRTVNFNASTIALSQSTGIDFGSNTGDLNLTFNAGTSQINLSNNSPNLTTTYGQTFYNVSCTSGNIATPSIAGRNVFNNLTFAGRTLSGICNLRLYANQTINNTLTISAGTNATCRTFLQSDTLGTTRTLTCAAFSGTDVDFRDITIAGAAAPVSGTRFGDCKGNSGVTFGAGVNKYWNLVSGGTWYSTAWATSSGGAVAANNFPLAQDTVIFEATGLNSGSSIATDYGWNVGSINMSARTSNTMTLTLTSSMNIYGNWVNGTGTTLTGTSTTTFCGRGNQTITSAGRTFTPQIIIDALTGSVTLQDAFVNSYSGTALGLNSVTFNANGYNVTCASGGFSTAVTTTRTVAVGAGTWTLGALNPWIASPSTNFTVTGTGTISLTSASGKVFTGGDISYLGITLNQGGAGTLTIVGNNTFKDITNTYSATGATNITFSTTTQRVTQFTGTGTAGKILTIQGSSASSPGTLILTGGTNPNVDYLTITGVRAYNLANTWYAGANSINNGSLGWIFNSYSAPTITTTGKFLLLFD
jgi:hypothetical protein